MKKVLGVILGIVAAMVIVSCVEYAGSLIHPLGAEVDLDDQAALAAWMARVPLSAKLLVVAGWALGAYGGAWLALRVADRPWAGWIVAGFVVAGVIYNIVTIPHPLWMQAAGIILPLLAGWLAVKVHHKPYPGEPLLG